jgi:hypothetical protein
MREAEAPPQPRPIRHVAPHLSAVLERRERRMRALRMALESLLGLFSQVAGGEHAANPTLRKVRRALAEARREATGARH